jgi:hypothetical protein
MDGGRKVHGDAFVGHATPEKSSGRRTDRMAPIPVPGGIFHHHCDVVEDLGVPPQLDLVAYRIDRIDRIEIGQFAAAERALERHIVSESRVLRFCGLIIGRHHANVMQAGAPGIQGFFVN